MAALEYLTQNSLTAHPFKSGRAVLQNNNHPIGDDWFYDLLFVSYSEGLNSAYIAQITKNEDGSLELTFGDVDTQQALTPVVQIDAEDVVSHYKNPAKSFAYSSNSKFAVKLIFASGLVEYSPFSQTYTKEETTLAATCVILNSPRLNSLTFSRYDSTYITTEGSTESVLSSQIVQVKNYTYPTVPVVSPRHNSVFTLSSINQGALSVYRGAGSGLYDGCPQSGNITDVYTINSATPNAEGALFLNASSCYTVSALTTATQDSLDVYGYLDPYYNFEIHTSPTTTVHKDVVELGRSLVFQNFCKPKCPPENMSAFAHYLNRVVDGAKELDLFATKGTETRGQGTATLKVFTASAFCVVGDTTFARCSDPLQEGYIGCSSGFVKYFHEGRTLQLYYDSITLLNFTIVEVLSSTTVRLDNQPPIPRGEYFSFRVIDNGVVSNMNCAAAGYNLTAEQLLNPYFNISYTTSEAYNTAGDYVTYLAVVVSVFNPSSEARQILVAFNNNTALTQQGNYKIRDSDGVHSVLIPETTISCRSYAFFEAVYYITCGETGGQLLVDVYDETVNTVRIGKTYTLPGIDGAECPGTLSGGSVTIRVLHNAESIIFSSNTVALNSNISSVIFSSAIPAWLSLTPDYAAHSLTVGIADANYLPTNSTAQVVYFRGYGGDVPGVITQLTIEYITTPVLLAPLGSTYSPTAPLLLSKFSTYTSDLPVLQVAATNMTPFAGSYTVDRPAFYYGLTGSLAAGLSFDTSTGKIIGSLDESVGSGTSFSVTLTAHNPAGFAENQQTVNFYVLGEGLPAMLNSSSEVYEADNLQIYTAEAPLLTLSATNTPIYRYDIAGDLLPAGLYLSKPGDSGVIIGKLVELESGTAELHVSAANFYGASTPIDITINYTVYPPPSITYPDNGAIIASGATTVFNDLSPITTITASSSYTGTDEDILNAVKNTFTVSGLPPGFSLDSATGVVTGQLESTAIPAEADDDYIAKYVSQFTVTNAVGSSNSIVYFYFTKSLKPTVYNITTGKVFLVRRDNTYTAASPVFEIQASNFPTSYAVTGLPLGLQLDGAKLVGTVQAAQAAGDYIISISASNMYGTSAEVAANIRIPILLTGSTAEVSLELSHNYPRIFTATATPLAEESITVTTTTVPPGLSFAYVAGVGYVLSGTPSALGTFALVFTATTVTYGTSTVSLIVNVLSRLFSISGRVVGDGPSPAGIPDVVLSISDGLYTATTDVGGYYTITGVGLGAYNVYTASETYSILPEYRAAKVTNADLSGVNFVATGPFRLVTGSVTLDDDTPLTGITISDNTTRSSTTNSYGIYELFVLTTTDNTITLTTEGYVYTPSSIAIYAGTSTLTGENFKAKAKVYPIQLTDLAVSLSGLTANISFTVPSENLSTNTSYQYTLNNGNSWITSSNSLANPSPIVVDNLTLGESYYVKVRAVNTSGAGPATDTVVVTAPNVPTTPLSLLPSLTDLTLSISFDKSTSRGSSVLGYEYSLDNGVSWVTSPVQDVENPSPIVIEVVPSATFKVTVRATSALGPSNYSRPISITSPSAPGAPIITSVTPTGSGAITFNFTSPTSTGGAAITNYAYSVSTEQTDSAYVAFDPAAPTKRSVAVAGLTNGELYYVKIRSLNLTGAGPASTSLTVTPIAPPAAPVIVSAVGGNSSITVNYTATSSTQAPITSYSYSYTSGATWVAVEPSSPGVIVLPNLVNGRSYTVKIRAHNSVGVGVSEAVTVALPEPKIELNSLTTSGGRGLIANFTPVNMASTLESYEYSIGTTWIRPSTNLTTSPITITKEPSGNNLVDLTYGKNYIVKIRARYSGGAYGPVSNALSTVLTAVPGPPTISLVASAPDSLIVTFEAADDRGSTITDYEYSVAPGVFVSLNRGSKTTPYTITGLNNGSQYTVYLRAKNSIGTGAPSVGYGPVVPAALPSAPTITGISTGLTYLDVYFTPPTNNGGSPIINYSYTVGAAYVPLPTGTELTSPIRISSLTAGTTYDVRLKAITAIGSSTASNVVRATPHLAPSPPVIGATGGNRSINVTILPGAANGIPLSAYEYRTSMDNGTLWSVWVRDESLGTITVRTISNITPRPSLYALQMRAVNSLNETSGISNTVRNIEVGSVLDPPTIIRGVPTNNGVMIYFKAPDNATIPLLAPTDYMYMLNQSPPMRTIGGLSDAVPYEITAGYTPGNKKSTLLFAINHFGTSDPSNELVIGPRLATAPGLAAEAISMTAIQITFSYPSLFPYSYISTDPVKYPVRQYAYELRGGTPPVTITKTAATNIDAILANVVATVTDLTPGTYTINASPITVFGVGMAATPIYVSLPTGPPSGPPNLEVTVSRVSSITFSYSAGGIELNGGAVKRYAGAVTNNDTGLLVVNLDLPGGVPGGSHTITGLTYPGNYTIALAIITSGGEGPTATVVGATSISTPNNVTLVSATGGYDSITSTFSDPLLEASRYRYALIEPPGSGNIAYIADLPDVQLSPSGLATVTIPMTQVHGVFEFMIISCMESLCNEGSNKLSIEVFEGKAPDSPIIISYDSPTTGVLYVTYGPPASSNGYPISRYRLFHLGQEYYVYTSGGTISLSGLTDGQNYVGSVEAENVKGLSEPAVWSYTLPSMPGPIGRLSGRAASATTVTMTITGAAPSIVPVLRYEYTYIDEVNYYGDSSLTYGTWYDTGLTAPGNFQISGLTEFSNYRVAVRAVNARGASPEFITTTVSPHTIILPQQPTQFELGSTYNTVTVVFSNPYEPQDPLYSITGYQYRKSINEAWVNFSGSPLVLPAAINSTLNIEIRAVNADGAGPVLYVSAPTTPVPLPSVPTDAVVTSTYRTISVAFNPNDTPDDIGVITGYQYRKNNNGTWVNFSGSPLTIQTDIDTTLAISIRSVNIAGTGPALTVTGSTTPTSVPSAPTNLVVTSPNLTPQQYAVISIAFDPPTIKGDDSLLRYEYTYEYIGSGLGVFGPYTTETSPVVVSIAPYTPATVNVYAVNAKGNGASAHQTVTALSYPWPPDRLEVDPLYTGGGTMHVVWNAAYTPGWVTPWNIANPNIGLRYRLVAESMDTGLTIRNWLLYPTYGPSYTGTRPSYEVQYNGCLDLNPYVYNSQGVPYFPEYPHDYGFYLDGLQAFAGTTIKISVYGVLTLTDGVTTIEGNPATYFYPI